MIYARMHDQTVTEDCYAATKRMEQQLLVASSGDIGYLSDADHLGASVIGPEQERLLAQCPFGRDQASPLLLQLSRNTDPARSQQELEAKHDLLVSLSVQPINIHFLDSQCDQHRHRDRCCSYDTKQQLRAPC